MKYTFSLFFYLLFVLCQGQSVSLTFEVNMTYQIEQGNFNPSSEFVDIAGTFNNWGSTINQLSDPDNDGTWTTTIGGFSSGETIEFKFRYNGTWDDREEFPGVGNNRVHTVASGDETLSFWYNDEEPPTGPAVAGISASSSFAFAGGSIIFTEDASGLVESYEWTFEGGDPSSSTASSVEVTYSEPGTYDVRLQVANSFSEDELLLQDFITVGEQSNDDLAWWNEAVFYEIFVRSFYDSDGDGIGDFQGIIEKLDYLNDGNPATKSDLGITGIWLMPIHDSPSYHGYDVNDYRSINPDYGTMEDFKQFLDEAHKRGIKVIIDLVLNHSSSQIEWFQNAKSSTTAAKRNWYRWSPTNPNTSGPWGQNVWHSSSTGYYYGLFFGGMPDLNYDEPEVKDEMFDVTQFWLEDIGIDGFRLDAVKYIKEDGNKLEDIPATHDFWREWVAHVKSTNPEALTVGEAWTSTEKIVPYVVNQGLDFCFDFDLGSAILAGVRTGNAEGLVNQVNKIINSYPYYQFGTFTTNHDMNRLMNELSSDEDKVKLAAAIYLTLPGIPFIYYGEELGMLGSKPDENIRRPMAWSDEEHAGFSTTNPWNEPPSNYETNNLSSQKSVNGSLFNWYRKLIQLRNESGALQTGDYTRLSSPSSVFVFERALENERVVVLVNLSTSAQTVTLAVSDKDRIGNEPALVDHLGTDRIDILNKSEITVTIEGGTAKVLVPGNLTLGLEKQASLKIFPNPVGELVFIQADTQFNYRVIGLDGRVFIEGSGNRNHQISMEGLPPATYLLVIGTKEGHTVRKLIVD